MAKTARTTLPSRTGSPIIVYGRITADGSQVAVWTKYQNAGFYNLDRFPDRRLTGATLAAVLTGAAS